MQPEAIKSLLEKQFPTAHIQVKGEGSHYDLLIVSDAFAGLRSVKKQQMVYAVINEHIADGSMHAVNMKLYTQSEWDAENV